MLMLLKCPSWTLCPSDVAAWYQLVVKAYLWKVMMMMLTK